MIYIRRTYRTQNTSSRKRLLLFRGTPYGEWYVNVDGVDGDLGRGWKTLRLAHDTISALEETAEKDSSTQLRDDGAPSWFHSVITKEEAAMLLFQIG